MIAPIDILWLGVNIKPHAECSVEMLERYAIASMCYEDSELSPMCKLNVSRLGISSMTDVLSFETPQKV